MAQKLHSEAPAKFDGGLIDHDALKRYVDRIENLHTDRDAINDDIKAVYAEAKSAGFVTGIMRQIVRERRMEEAERHDHYALLDAYRSALGMLADTPLGEAALARAAKEPVRRRGRARKSDGETRASINDELVP
jgi:uncharacterized protein (UPF0335 family)